MCKKKFMIAIINLLILLGIFYIPNQKITANASEKLTDTTIQDNQYNIQEILDNNKQQVSSVSAQKWICINDKLTYPVTPDSDEWKTLSSYEEMVSACTIPNDILQKTSTQELLKLVMDYPLLSNLYFYDTYEQGLYFLTEDFNGLRELLNREDVSAILIEYYKNYKIPTISANSENTSDEIKSITDKELNKKIVDDLEKDKTAKQLESDFKTIANIELVETLLVNNVILDNCSQKQISEIANIASDKFIIKKKSALFSGKENLIYKAAAEVNNIDILGTSDKRMRLFATANNATYVTTPKGTKVPVYTPSYGGAQWSKTITAETKKNYPKANVIQPADNRYNCHSYAWYKQSNGNIYWMQTPSAYFKDGSYKKITNKANRGANNRITWTKIPLANPIIHSGYLVSINKNGSYNIYSKWGQGPLMQHSANYSPYDGTRNYYKKTN